MLVAISGTLFFTSCGPKDSKIQADAITALQATPSVSVTVVKGVATISGAVDSDASKAAAEAVIKGIKGVKSVTNEITVTPPVVAPTITSNAPTIAGADALTAAVKDATKDFPGITADVNDGVIKVAGTITAAKWKTLKQILDGLHPKKVDASGITVK